MTEWEAVQAAADALGAKTRLLEDREKVIPSRKVRGNRGWWGMADGGRWYFYLPLHARPNLAIRAVEAVAGTVEDRSSDEEPYFWCSSAQMTALATRGPVWCQTPPRRRASEAQLEALRRSRHAR